MKRLVFGALAALALILCAPAARAQNVPIPNDSLGYCFALAAPGNQAISASCTVTVYLTGTTTPATIYSDAIGTAKANPFTAATNGTWRFYAALGAGLDVRISGGVPTITPYTITATGTTSGVATFSSGNLVPLFTTSVANPTTAPALSFSLTNAAANTVFGRFAGTTGAPSYGTLTSSMVTPPGSTTDVIYNSAGAFAGSDLFTWNNATKTMSVSDSMGSPVVRLLSNGGAGKIIMGTGTGPFIQDNSGSGWSFTSQNGQDTLIGTANDPASFRFGGDNVIAHGAARFGIGSAEGTLYMNDGTSGAGTFLGPLIMAGAGTPEGTFNGRVGSIYMRSDGTATTSVYFKENGVSNLGWQQVAMQDDVQTLTNKTLLDTTTTIGNTSTPSKAAKFSLAGATAAKTATLTFVQTDDRTYTFPDTTGTVCLSTISCSPLLYDISGAVQASAHEVVGSCILGTSCAVTLTGAAIYSSSTSYTCSAQDQTAAAATKVAQASGSAFTITGTGTDTIRFLCTGN